MTKNTSSKKIPLKCSFCGETWVGATTMIGKYCDQNTGRLIGAPGDVHQCDPEELERDIDWDVEVF